MARRREILDSEDDGSDFGDDPQPLADGDDAPRDENGETVNASHHASTGSTDPTFFQRVYDQQQATADGRDVVPDTTPANAPDSLWTEVSPAPPPGQKPQPKDHSSFTSITDPAPASRRPKRTKEVPQTEVIDLTDITTPSKDPASNGSDVWDLPSSARSLRATRTYGKRKNSPQQLSIEEATPDMLPTQDPYAFPEATPPAKKKTRRSTPPSSAQQAKDFSPEMLVPSQQAVNSDRQTRSSRKKKASFGTDSSMPDTASSLYVMQSALTASQKQQYRMVALSSETMQDVTEMSLPAHLVGGGEMYRSSDATTIAYPTPSRIGSSRQLPVPTDRLEEDRVSGAFLERHLTQLVRCFGRL